MRARLALLTILSASGCAATGDPLQHYQSALGGRSYPSTFGGDANRQPTHVQGMLGASYLNIQNIDIDPSLGSFASSDETEMPLIGGAAQLPLGGEHRIHIGLEGGFTLGWQGNIEAFAFGSNGAVVVADTDLWLTDLFGGVYGDIELGDRLRIYAGVGPTLQFGSIDYDYDDPVLGHVSINDDGFGTGYYSRIGIEFTISPGMAIGASYRYVDSNIDFGGQISDMDLKQDQYMLTCTQSF